MGSKLATSSYHAAVCAVVSCDRIRSTISQWPHQTQFDVTSHWINAISDQSVLPSQGWKLHLSATCSTAAEVLARALPVLSKVDVSFKVAATARHLESLNQGEFGLSQVGKFITVYPADDAQAVALAVDLDHATNGLTGPSIPSDRPLRVGGGIVYYRYGSFRGLITQKPTGELVYAIRSPEGKIIPDPRLSYYVAPEWAVDPFIAAGVSAATDNQDAPVAGRYITIALLHRGPRGKVELAIDVIGLRRCIIKRARRGDAQGANRDDDAAERLKHERDILELLSSTSTVPAIYDFVERGNEYCLIMEDLGDTSLEIAARNLRARGLLMENDAIRKIGQDLSGVIQAIHEAGFVYRDLKPSNVMLCLEEKIRLVDFELAHSMQSCRSPYSMGTLGYVSPQQLSGKLPSPLDDIYALGATLYFLATGAEPTAAPARVFSIETLRLLNPKIDTPLCNVILRCLKLVPSKRFASASAVADALSTTGRGGKRGTVLSNGAASTVDANGKMEHFRARCLGLAKCLTETLVVSANRSSHDSRVTWTSTHSESHGLPYCSINMGSAGSVLALADLAPQFAETCPSYMETLAKASCTLMNKARPAWVPSPGLYVGEAGVGAALLRSGQVLRDAQLVEASCQISRSIGLIPYMSPDLYNGAAGRIRYHLFVWDETGDQEHLSYAIEGGDFLLRKSQRADGGGFFWTIPPGYDGLSGRALMGYAHGAAGIADVLLDLHEATSDPRYLSGALEAARWISQHTISTLSNDEGVDWPAFVGKPASNGTWCNGAAGVGQFYLHASKFAQMPWTLDLAIRAARTVAAGTRWTGPVPCHGLAGNIEFFLDMFQSTNDASYLEECRVHARLLEHFAVKHGGFLYWSSELPTIVSPDYMVGFAGVAMCFLRLSSPEKRPRQLTRAGFRVKPLA